MIKFYDHIMIMYEDEYEDENESLCTPSKLSVFAQTIHNLGKNSDLNVIITLLHKNSAKIL